MIIPDDAFPDEAQLREAIAAAKELQAKVLETTEDFPPEGRKLRDKLRAAAERTVVNLELALQELLKAGPTVH